MTRFSAGPNRFGRVIDCPWYSDAEAGYVERVRYGYDAAGNRLWRQNAVAPPGNDELYGCDGLNRLVEMARGTLAQDATHVENVQLSQDWTLDPTGNWNHFVQTDVADPSGNLDQSRWQNAANEITRIARRYGADWATPAYDAAGNMTSMPQPLDPPRAFAGTYDAWNRLTGVGAASYGYDGLHRRLGAPHESGGVRQFYYTADWRLVETRRSSEPGQGEYVYLWGQRYIDDLVLLTQPASGTSVAPPLNHYALQDANWNVTAICGNTGDVLERVRYTPYGLPTFLDAQFEPQERSQPHWRILYAGYWWDAESGLYQVRRRELQTAMGVWLTRDPIGYLADINLYRYCTNDPLSRTDPLGLAGEDIEYIDYLVNKYGLSAEGRAALHQALQELKGAGGLAPKAAAEAEAQSIAALGGKFLKAGGTALSVLGIWLALENTAQAAEIPKDWREGAAGWDQRCSCECARFQASLIVPSWWAIFDEVEWGPETRASQWVSFGRLNAKECSALEDPPRVISQESVVGFTIYNTSRVRCRFGGATYGTPKKCCD